MSDDLRSLRELIAALPAEKRAVFLDGLPAEVLAAATHEWPFWARPDQLEPPGPWRTWLMRSGRGAGKTRAGAETVRSWVERGVYGRLHLVGRTDSDVRETMIQGTSGLLRISAARFSADLPLAPAQARVAQRGACPALLSRGARPPARAAVRGGLV